MMRQVLVTTFLGVFSLSSIGCSYFGFGSGNSGASDLASALTFYASFDAGTDADYARGESGIYTTTTGKIPDGTAGLARDDVAVVEDGRHGGALHFGKKGPGFLYYRGERNVDFRPEAWSGTLSFWLRLTPEEDLEPGYCDPIQITDKTWNDAAMFVDFTKDNPREFRLGVFSDLKSWNPTGRKWEDIAADERPMVVVSEHPFRRDRWTHVAFTFEGVNGGEAPARARLYLDGRLAGELERPQLFTWDVARSVIMVGVNYIGDFDELAIFNRSLSADEVKALFALASGVGALVES